MRRTTILLAGLVPAIAGCTTITRGTEDTFVVETEPAGAEVSTSNGHACRSTPCALRMDRDSEFVVTIEKPGYETHTASITHEVADAGAAGMAGNLIFGGLIGVAVDAGSGAMYDLTPNPLRVTLAPDGARPVPAPQERMRETEPAPPAEAPQARAEETPPQAEETLAEAAPAEAAARPRRPISTGLRPLRAPGI